MSGSATDQHDGGPMALAAPCSTQILRGQVFLPNLEPGQPMCTDAVLVAAQLKGCEYVLDAVLNAAWPGARL